MPATIKDVAREAGVSISTVSKVMNDVPGISEATALKVKETMRRLDYAPNSRAAGLARTTKFMRGMPRPSPPWRNGRPKTSACFVSRAEAERSAV